MTVRGNIRGYGVRGRGWVRKAVGGDEHNNIRAFCSNNKVILDGEISQHELSEFLLQYRIPFLNESS